MRKLILLVAKRLTKLVADAGSINQLNLTPAFWSLILGQNPDVCRNTGVVEQICRHLYDCFKQIIFKKISSDLRFAGGRTTGK